jgi:hypothetical protein
VFFRAGTFDQAGHIIAAMFGAGGDQPMMQFPAVIMPHFAVFAFVLGAIICVAPILWKNRSPSAAPWWTTESWRMAASVGALLLFVLAAIHLTNMRITPLIYFKF